MPCDSDALSRFLPCNHTHVSTIQSRDHSHLNHTGYFTLKEVILVMQCWWQPSDQYFSTILSDAFPTAVPWTISKKIAAFWYFSSELFWFSKLVLFGAVLRRLKQEVLKGVIDLKQKYKTKSRKDIHNEIYNEQQQKKQVKSKACRCKSCGPRC